MIDFFSELKADWSWQACRPEDDPFSLCFSSLLAVHVKTSPLNLEPISSSPLFSQSSFCIFAGIGHSHKIACSVFTLQCWAY